MKFTAICLLIASALFMLGGCAPKQDDGAGKSDAKIDGTKSGTNMPPAGPSPGKE